MLGVVGDLVEDVVVWMRGPLRTGTDNPGRVFTTRGGSAANVAAFAAPAHPTRFIGCVGEDVAGDTLVAQLAEHGVEVRVQHRGSTGVIVVLVGDDGERTMIPDRGAAALLEPVDDAWLEGLRMLHVPSYAFLADPLRGTVLDMVRRVKEAGGAVSVDVSSTDCIDTIGVAEYGGLLSQVRPAFVIANRDEAGALGLAGRGAAAAARVAALPATTFVLKNGAAPTRVLRHGHPPLTVPVPPVDRVLDSTGAGDAFAAGFLARYLSPEPCDVVEACEAGHALAASVLKTPGASTADPAATPEKGPSL